MYKNKNILAIIPARGGSKGIPKKNLKKINGIPLVCLAGICAQKIKQIDRIIISTDCEEIAQVSKKYGFEIPFKRPKSISRDSSKDIDVIMHGLIKIEKIDNIKYDVIVFLQPTSPLRTPAQVFNCIKFLINESYDSVWTVSKTENKNHPFKQLRINDNKCLEYYLPEGNQILPRQDLPSSFHVNGIAYVLTRETVLEKKSRLGEKNGAYIIKNKYANIDTPEDLKQVRKSLTIKLFE